MPRPGTPPGVPRSEDEEDYRDFADLHQEQADLKAMSRASSKESRKRSPRGGPCKATKGGNSKKVEYQPVVSKKVLAATQRREAKDRMQRERLQARAFKEMDVFLDLLGVAAAADAPPTDSLDAAMQPQPSMASSACSRRTTTADLDTDSAPQNLYEDGCERERAGTALGEAARTAHARSLPQPSCSPASPIAGTMNASQSMGLPSPSTYATDFSFPVGDLLRSLLPHGDDVVDGQLDQFREFKQKAQVIQDELDNLESSMWMGNGERLESLRSCRCKGRDLLKGLEHSRKMLAQSSMHVAAMQELRAAFDHVFKIMVPGLISVVESVQASVVELFDQSRAESQVEAAAGMASRVLTAAEAIANDFLREPRSMVLPADMSALLDRLALCVSALVESSGKASSRLADSLLVRERLCHDVLTQAAGAWPKALQAAWNRSSSMVVEHAPRCWWLPRLQLEQQLMRHLLHAVRCALEMHDGFVEEAQRRFWLEEEEVDIDRGMVGSFLDEKEVQVHGWVPDLLLVLMERVGVLHCDVCETLDQLPQQQHAQPGPGSSNSAAFSFSFSSVSSVAATPLHSAGGQGHDRHGGLRGSSNAGSTGRASGSGAEAAAAAAGSARISGSGGGEAASTSGAFDDACVRKLVHDLQADFSALVIANTRRMALLCARHKLLPAPALKLLFDQARKALQLFQSWDNSTLGLPRQGIDIHGLVCLGREHLRHVMNGYLRIKDLLAKLQATTTRATRDSPFARVVFEEGAAACPAAPTMTKATAKAAAKLKASESLGQDTKLIPWSVLKKHIACEAGVEVLGTGSSGQVLLSQYEGEPVATKLIKIQNGDFDDNVLASFKREVNIQQQLTHKNIVRLLGACWEDEEDETKAFSSGPKLAIVMELCDGDLYHLLAKARRVRDALQRGVDPSHLKPAFRPAYNFFRSWPQRLEVAHGIAAGLEYMHRRECVHRDLTSYNVLLKLDTSVSSGSLTAKLCDFNYSQVLPQGQQLMKSRRDANSPKWQSPEVLSGGTYGHPSDVFSFGVILWEIITLQEPWHFDRTQLAAAGARPAQIDFAAYEHDVDIGLKVSQGIRLALPEPASLQPALPAEVTDALLSIVSSCWKQAAAERPIMHELSARLAALVKQVGGGQEAAAASTAGAAAKAKPGGGIGASGKQQAPSSNGKKR